MSSANATQEDVRVLDIVEHIRTKDMWAGAKARVAVNMVVFATSTTSASAVTREMSPALLKCVDEPLVNALDQIARCALQGSARVTRVDVAYDASKGTITIANDGAGIPITKHSSGRYTPEVMFGVIFAGSNMATQSAAIGGTNGIGVKITNIHSREFEIFTCDLERGLTYTQTWHSFKPDHPCIVPMHARASYRDATRVKFTLDWDHFATTPQEFEEIAYTRAIWASMYVRAMYPHAMVTWNGAPLERDIDKYATAVFAGCADFHKHVATASTELVIYASVGARRASSMSIVNGIVVPQGNHLRAITSAVRERAERILHGAQGSASNMLRMPHMAYILIWRTASSSVHWTSQTKDTAQFSSGDIDALMERIGSQFIDAVAQDVAKRTLAAQAQVPARPANNHADVAKKMAIDKYTPALCAGSRKLAERKRCALLVAEGDSAMTQLKIGLATLADGNKYFGILSLGGVILNVRRTDSKKVRENKVIGAICAVLGLRMGAKYNNPASRDALNYGSLIGCVDQDLDGVGNIFSLVLNFFHIYFPELIEAGYVKRLVTPIKRAYPRGKTNLPVLEFYDEREYDAFVAAQQQAQALATAAVQQYKIRYYKGLGTHEASEIEHIFANFNEHVITYEMDAKAETAFEIYLGDDADKRKVQLSRPAPPIDEIIEAAIAHEKKQPTSYHLEREAHAYQLDNLSRKIADVHGGMNQVGRKIYAGCVRVFAGPEGTARRKVAELAARIAATEHYHHGEASLENAIKHRAFIAPGGCQLPLINPHGQFGSRLGGGDDAASSRYIFASLNGQLSHRIFVPDDTPLLEVRMDEGERGEPKYYVPIVPMAILESQSLPAHGWNINIWAREFDDVLANVRAMIHSNGSIAPAPMRPCCYPIVNESIAGACAGACAGASKQAWYAQPWTTPSAHYGSAERVVMDCSRPADRARFAWHGIIVERMGAQGHTTWSLGTYVRESPDAIRITELPLRVWTYAYVGKLRADERNIADVACSINLDVNLLVKLTPEGRDALAALQAQAGASNASVDDPVICFLGLRNRMCDNINLTMPDDSVRTFPTYESVVALWFGERRALYATRIERMHAILELWCDCYRNILRFIGDASAHSILRSKHDLEVHALLKGREYMELNYGTLSGAGLARCPSAAAVRSAICGPSASYDYILSLHVSDLTQTGKARYERLLAAREQELRTLDARSGGIFVGANMWLAELDELEKVVHLGRSTAWRYTKKKVNFA